MKTVYVGLSGGVDSSVAAALLLRQGYNVVGVYMKNWSKDLPGMPCPWEEDYQDAKRVAVQLGIDFKMFDFEKEYHHKVVEYMIDEYKAGRTPNPDIMCNQEVKFKLFLNTALEQGADMIAAGHYARVGNRKWELGNREAEKSEELTQFPIPNSQFPSLLQAKDKNKDQTYFLYRVEQAALERTIFPIGDYTKPEIRAKAKEFGLVTAIKKESMGICFVGKVGIKDFLSQYVVAELGPIVNQYNMVVGQHNGAIFYTLGQRHGLNVGGGLPYYVAGKDMAKNTVYVTTDLQDERLWSNTITIASPHWIAGQSPVVDSSWQLVDGKKKTKPKTSNYQHLRWPADTNYQIRTRHRAKLIKVKHMNKLENGNFEINIDEDIKALTPGQSAVIYSGEICLGGGIVV